MATSRLDQLHRRATRFLRDLDADTATDKSEKLDFLDWLMYEFERRAAALQPPPAETPQESFTRFRPIYM